MGLAIVSVSIRLSQRFSQNTRDSSCWNMFHVLLGISFFEKNADLTNTTRKILEFLFPDFQSLEIPNFVFFF